MINIPYTQAYSFSADLVIYPRLPKQIQQFLMVQRRLQTITVIIKAPLLDFIKALHGYKEKTS